MPLIHITVRSFIQPITSSLVVSGDCRIDECVWILIIALLSLAEISYKTIDQTQNGRRNGRKSFISSTRSASEHGTCSGNSSLSLDVEAARCACVQHSACLYMTTTTTKKKRGNAFGLLYTYTKIAFDRSPLNKVDLSLTDH